MEHPWFHKEIANNGIKIAFKFKPNENQQLGNNPLLSATPVMAGRKLKDLPPETPFMQSRGVMPDSTPVIKPIQLKAGAPGLRQMNAFGRIDPSKAAAAKQEEAKKPFIAAIPAFKAAALKDE